MLDVPASMPFVLSGAVSGLAGYLRVSRYAAAYVDVASGFELDVITALCGAFNELLVAKLGLPSIVVTIGTLSLFRGIAYIMLGDKAFSRLSVVVCVFWLRLCLVGYHL